MRRGLRMAVVTVLVTLAGVAGAQAQDSPRRTPQDRAEMERRVRAQMQRLLQERLELTDEQSEQLATIARSFDEQRRALRRSEIATRRRVEALVGEGDAAEGEAAQLLERMVELRREEAQLFADEQAALLEVLSPEKVLQLQALREEMGRRIRALRRGGERGRRPGGDRPGNVDWILGVDLSS